jgi:hypothetical protein
MQQKCISFFVLGLMALVFGCTDDVVQPSADSVGAAYFPLEVGRFYVYDVEETIYNLTGANPSTYQLRETVFDSFPNLAGGTTFKIIREKNTGDGWRSDLVWTATKSPSKVVVLENNATIIKMVFPLKNGLTWDGNSLNATFKSDFTAEFVSEPFAVGTKIYDNVLKIAIADVPENLTGVDQKYEYYHAGIGLISKDFKTLRYCTRNCASSLQIEGGLVLKQNLVEYGKI